MGENYKRKSLRKELDHMSVRVTIKGNEFTITHTTGKVILSGKIADVFDSEGMYFKEAF